MLFERIEIGRLRQTYPQQKASQRARDSWKPGCRAPKARETRGKQLRKWSLGRQQVRGWPLWIPGWHLQLVSGAREGPTLMRLTSWVWFLCGPWAPLLSMAWDWTPNFIQLLCRCMSLVTRGIKGAVWLEVYTINKATDNHGKEVEIAGQPLK